MSLQVSIVLADRRSNDFLSSGSIEQLERACGQACLAALAAVPLVEPVHLQQQQASSTA